LDITKDYIKRYTQLLKEHNAKEIYLIYAHQIKNEAIEHELHHRLKSYVNVEFYPVKKHKQKNEKEILCTETYIFKYSTFNTIIQEVYKMESKYENSILDRKIILANIEKDRELIKKEKEITLANIEKEKEITLANIEKEKVSIEKDRELIKKEKEITLANIEKEKEITLANIEKEREPMRYEIKKADIEYIKLQIELAKLNK